MQGAVPLPLTVNVHVYVYVYLVSEQLVLSYRKQKTENGKQKTENRTGNGREGEESLYVSK